MEGIIEKHRSVAELWRRFFFIFGIGQWSIINRTMSAPEVVRKVDRLVQRIPRSASADTRLTLKEFLAVVWQHHRRRKLYFLNETFSL